MVKSGKAARRQGALAESPSHLMHRVLQLALNVYAEELGPDGLTQRQFAVLEAVAARSGLTQTELVKATGIDRSTLADLVARMTTKGLLERERSNLDARAKAVRLSAAGEAALSDAKPKVEAADKRILGLLPKGKRTMLVDLLADLAATADAQPDIEKAEAKAAKKAAKDARKAEEAQAKAAGKPKKGKVEKSPKAKGKKDKDKDKDKADAALEPLSDKPATDEPA